MYFSDPAIANIVLLKGESLLENSEGLLDTTEIACIQTFVC